MEIVSLIKKYKKFLIIVVILILISILLFFVSRETSVEDGYSNKMDKIVSPYSTWTEELIIESEIPKTKVSEKGKILSVSGFNTKVFAPFVNKFYTLDGEIDFSKDVSIQFNKQDFILFYPTTGILSVISEKGIILDKSILSEEDLNEFFEKNFEIESVKVLSNSQTSLGNEFKGRYILNDIEMGSSFLNGYSYIIKTNAKGNIINMSILLLSESNTQKYQYLPLESVNELLSNSRYPKMMGENIIEERYYAQSNPFKLVEYYAKEYELIYLFNDIDNGYILPTYLLKGDGRIKDSYNEEYWSETEFFLCAIDPSYLIAKKTDDSVEKEEIKEEEGAPFIRSD